MRLKSHAILLLTVVLLGCDEQAKTETPCICAGYTDQILPLTSEGLSIAPPLMLLSPEYYEEIAVPVSKEVTSYFILRESLERGDLPPLWMMNLSELSNYFADEEVQELVSPVGLDEMTVSYQVGKCPWRKQNFLIRLELTAHATLSGLLTKIRPQSEWVNSFRVLSTAYPEQPYESVAYFDNDQVMINGEVANVWVEIEPRFPGLDQLQSIPLFEYEFSFRLVDSEDINVVAKSIAVANVPDEAPNAEFEFLSGVLWFGLEVMDPYGTSLVLDRDLPELINRNLDYRNHPRRGDIVYLIEMYRNIQPYYSWNYPDMTIPCGC